MVGSACLLVSWNWVMHCSTEVPLVTLFMPRKHLG